MSWRVETFGNLLTESKISCENPDSNKRIRVKLNVKGVEKRPDTNDKKGATKQYIRKSGQFIYGKQNFHKGAFGIIPKELDGYETSADIPSFDVREDCLAEWLYYFFKAGNRYLELTKYARGVGSKRIHPKQIANLKIPLPPIDEQKRIIEELKNIEKDEISTELTHQLDLVKKLRQAFLREAMQGKLVEQNPNDEPATELLAKIKAEKEQLIKEKKIKKQKPLPPISQEEIPFEIPENWVWCRLGEITTLVTDGKHGDCNNERNSGYYFLSAKDLQNNMFIYDNARQITYEDFIDTHKRTNLEPGDLCVVNTGATIGKTVIAPNIPLTYKTTFQKSVAIVKFFQNMTSVEFMEYLVKHQTPTLLKTSRGSAINNLLLGDMRNMHIPLPPLSEQKRIVAKLDELMAYCDSLEESIKNSQTQNEMLLQQVLREALEPKEITEKEEVKL